MTQSLLLVEDTPSLSLVYQTVLERAGHKVDCAFTLAEAKQKYAAGGHKVVLLDLILPDGDGQELLSYMVRSSPETKVIVITANGSVNRAVEAMRAGSFDFLVKPFDEHRLISAVQNAIQANALEERAEAGGALPDDDRFHGFIGQSPPMREIYRMVQSIGRSTATVFITGESGTGKEVCAQAIHTVSNRAKGPFIALNCGALPRDLLESEVFGHLKGSFTGAIGDKKGAAEAAHGGTLFLDEICEMDLSLQTKLLRFLQTSMIQPVGSNTPRAVDVRIVCATNRNPRDEVRAGRFREDLFYRLHVVPIHLPRLADRGDDVGLISRHALAEFSAEEGKNFKEISPSVTQLFRDYHWPGNVRQLLNALRNVVVLQDGPVVESFMLPPEISHDGYNSMAVGDLVDASQNPQALVDHDTAAPPHRGYDTGSGHGLTALAPAADPAAFDDIGANVIASLVGQRLSDVERELIEATIAHCGGSIPKAAVLLDVAASTIYRKRETWARETPAEAEIPLRKLS